LASTTKTTTATRTDATETGTSNTFNVVAGAVAHFAVATISSPQTAGTAFSITLTAQDANNNTVTGFTGTVTLSTTAGTITPATCGAFSGGVRTQSVTVTQAGTGKTITATRTSGSETGTSNAFTVNAGAVGTLAFVQPPTDATAGVAISPAVTVQAQDAFANNVP